MQCMWRRGGSKNRALGNPSDQFMFCGYLPSPGHLERPAIKIGFKPAKWNPVMSSDERVERQRRELNIFKRLRVSDALLILL